MPANSKKTGASTSRGCSSCCWKSALVSRGIVNVFSGCVFGCPTVIFVLSLNGPDQRDAHEGRVSLDSAIIHPDVEIRWIGLRFPVRRWSTDLNVRTENRDAKKCGTACTVCTACIAKVWDAQKVCKTALFCGNP